MKSLKMNVVALALLTGITFTSCDDNNDIAATITAPEANSVTMRNTYNDDHVPEISFASYLDIAFQGSDVEFPEALKADLTSQGGPSINALYSINFKENSIDYKLLPTADDAFWKTNYRTLEAGVKDRYYLTFAGTHNVASFTATDPAINVRVDSDNLLVVEVGEGFVFQPGSSFSINLTAKNAGAPAIAEGSEITMRNTYNDNEVPEISFASYLDFFFQSTLGEDGLDTTAKMVNKGVTLGDDGLDLTALISDSAVEFPKALEADLTGNGGVLINALYSIDFKENTLEYTLLPTANDPFWIQNYRVLETGVYDRYYLTYEKPHGIISFTATDPAVNVRVDSDKILVIEIGAGFDFKPGAAFSITLK